MKWFLTGLGVGVGVGLLLAPRSGEETRGQLWDSAGDLADRVQRRAGEIQDRIGDPSQLVNQGKQWAKGVTETVTSSAQDLGKKVASNLKVGSKVVLNTVSREDLMNVYGIGPVLADRIIASRPYSSDRDVVTQGIIPESAFERLKTELLDRLTA